MQKFRPIFDTEEEASRQIEWFRSLTPEEQDEYRRAKHREEMVDGFREGMRVIGRLLLIAFLIGLSIDLLWRTWVKIAVTFPTWHVPVISLHQFAVISLLVIVSLAVVQLARGEIRRPL